MNFKGLMSATALPALLAAGVAAEAAVPVEVSYTTSGTSGSWVYDFSVTNNLGGTNNIYFFGVSTPGQETTNPPSGWVEWGGGSNWSNQAYGGSSLVYNNPWFYSNQSSWIQPGTTLSGFKVSDNSTNPLAQISWFAFSQGGTYLGGGNFHTQTNPGFEGVATSLSVPSAVPEPATWAFMIVGFGGVGAAMRRSHRKENLTVRYA